MTCNSHLCKLRLAVAVVPFVLMLATAYAAKPTAPPRPSPHAPAPPHATHKPATGTAGDAFPPEAPATPENPALRPPSWAQPVESKNIANFYKLSTDLYRGAEPLPAGYAEMKKMGFKTVINLRAYHSDTGLCEAATLFGAQIRMKQLIPEPEEVSQFLRIVTNPELAPYFVHCDKGAERTGVMCAIYRVAVCGWSKEDAIEEMTRGGFGTHITWVQLVAYIESVDLQDLREQVAIGKAKAADAAVAAKTATPAPAPAPAAPPAPTPAAPPTPPATPAPAAGTAP